MNKISPIQAHRDELDRIWMSLNTYWSNKKYSFYIFSNEEQRRYAFVWDTSLNINEREEIRMIE